MKKWIWIAASMIITTVILIFINNMIYGTERIWIADYMPSFSMSGEIVKRTPWEIVKLTRTISDMKIAIVIGIVITAIESIVLYKKQIIKKDFKSIIILLILFTVPITISAVKLSSIYGFTC